MRCKIVGVVLTIVLSTVAAPLAATAQPAAKGPRIGVLLPSNPVASGHLLEAFRQGLREHGYVEGENLFLERRYGEARVERLSDLAAELVRTKVDLILTATDQGIQAARQHTRAIPIVMAISADPVGTGFVASLAHPGGNITGLTIISPELGGKRLELLKEAAPKISRVAFLWNSEVASASRESKEIETAARLLKLDIHSADVRRGEDLDGAFTALARKGANALILAGQTPVLFTNRERIAALAAKSRLSAMYPLREFVDAGGLMAYGPNNADLYRRAATYVHKILKGAKPADLPVEQPTRFELVINLKAAKGLGLTIPPSILIRAEEVIR